MSSEGVTCYERDEILCEDQMCLRTGCRLRNERKLAKAKPEHTPLPWRNIAAKVKP